MSINLMTGPKSLISLGVSLADLALLIDLGRKFGNFLRAAKNEDELFESIMEEREAILKRRGLVEAASMESKWGRLRFMYEGRVVSNDNTPKVASKQNLSALSWLMVALVAGLELCLPPNGVLELVLKVFVTALDGNQSIEESLRVQLPTLIASWRDVAAVRGVTRCMAYNMRRSILDKTRTETIPQLNPAEFQEADDFLVWLLRSEFLGDNVFKCYSAAIFALAHGLQCSGINISATSRRYETQPLVQYAETTSDADGKHHPTEHHDPFNLRRGVGSRAQLVSYPLRKPQSMIDTLGVQRDVINKMGVFWQLGEKAAKKFSFSARARAPYSVASEVEVFYSISGNDPVRGKYDPSLSLLAVHAFPEATESLLKAIDHLITGCDSHRIEWLSVHTELEFLMQTQASTPSKRPENMHLWIQYQALVFGFYYKLLEPLVSFDYVEKEEAFLQGIWGYGSTTTLAAFSQLGQALRKEAEVSRTHLLFVLAMMYCGRTTIYSRESSGSGLLGIRGPISIISLPLLRVTDKPEQIKRFCIVTLPMVDLAADADGELRAKISTTIQFEHPPVPPAEIRPHGPAGEWSVHAKMSTLFEGGSLSIVMAARTQGRLVGSFSPLAADAAFLSDCYQPASHCDGDEDDDQVVHGFEITDEHWQRGFPLRCIPEINAANTIGVIHSKGCAALRYAAAGFYCSAREEVAIATDNVQAAVGRVDGQGGGIIVT